jgi:hypothetical protein
VSIKLRRALTDEEIEAICTAAEEAARRSILSKISLKKVEDLNLTVEAEGDKPVSLTVEVGVETDIEDSILRATIDDATDAAFAAAESKVRELGLCDTSHE